MLAVTRLCLRTPNALRLTALDALQSVMQGIEEVKAIAPKAYDASFVEKVYAHLKPETKSYLENETVKMQNELDATMSCVRETVWEFFDLERTGAAQIQKVTKKEKKVVASKKRPAVSKKTSAKGLLKSKRINKLLKKGKAVKAASKANAVETAPKKAVSEKAAKIKKTETNAEKKTEGNSVQVKATKKVGKPSKAEQTVSKPEPEAKSVNDDVVKP